MEDERYGIWFEGNGGKVPPHWLLDEDGVTVWSGSNDEADQMRVFFGGEIIPIPRTRQPGVRG